MYSNNILLQSVQRFFAKTPKFMRILQVVLAVVAIVTGGSAIVADLLTTAHAAVPTWLSLLASFDVAKYAIGMGLGAQFAIDTPGTPPVAVSVPEPSPWEKAIIELAGVVGQIKTKIEQPAPVADPPAIDPTPKTGTVAVL